MMIRVLDRENTIFNRFIAQMRDVNVQGDSMRFPIWPLEPCRRWTRRA